METPPTPPPYQAPPKKGMHPMAIVGIGCGALLLLALIGGGLAFRWVTTTYKEMKAAAEENPDRELALQVIEMSPEVTRINEDEQAGTVVLEIADTGETATTTYADLASGSFRFTGPDGAEHALGENPPPPPAWVPVYPNIAEPRIALQKASATGTEGILAFTTRDSPEMAKAFYAGECSWSNSSSTSTSSFNATSRFSVSYSGSGRSLEIEGVQIPGDPLRLTVHYRE
ncbi:hypothetical protein [Haloferula sargassicola]|uniref:Uncharacterized protein n=1 Tax=Haloferula sargassicola TaxID=490096 RepID=A0ABP9UP59_9BACT